MKLKISPVGERLQLVEFEPDLGAVGVIDERLTVAQLAALLGQRFHLGLRAVREGDANSLVGS